MNKKQIALELRKALQLFLATLDADTQSESILSVASAFPKWKTGKLYKPKEVFQYGENAVGDAQLYMVLQEHTSRSEWTPDTATSLYKAIGVADNGIPEWVQPIGSTDAYMKGDVVMYNGVKYKSTCDNNVWSPDTYGWEVAS
jgi:hypothetical protein